MRELESRMSSTELSEWIAYYCLEPWGEDRADLRIAILSSLTANINRGKGTKPYKPVDFMPYYDREKDHDDEADLLAFLRKLPAPRRK